MQIIKLLVIPLQIIFAIFIVPIFIVPIFIVPIFIVPIFIVPILIAQNIYAADVWNYEVKNNDTIIAQISEKEISRINLKGEVIDRLHFIDGEIEFIKEEEDLYIKPLVKKPINMFLKTESGNTYKILFDVVDVPACQIFITKERKSRTSTAAKGKLAKQQNGSNGKKLVQLNKEQVDRSPASFEEKRISKIINILEIEDKNFGFKLKKARGNYKSKKYLIKKEMTATGAGLYAEKFIIKNISKELQILEEKEFTGEKIKAVYLSQEKLAPEQAAVLIKVYNNER